MLDPADDPLAAGELLLHAAGLRVEEVEVIPAVTFAGPEHFVGGIEVFEETAGARVVHEGFAVFLENRTHGAGRSIDGE